ncbi:MAG: AAA family ATPase [Thermosynechococcaceae cyanobacterium]
MNDLAVHDLTENNREDWQDRNEQYLAIALTWLRLKLTQRLQQEEGHLQQSLGQSTDGEAQLSHLQAALHQVAQADPSPALVQLSQRFGLTSFEQDTLLLCAAMELDTRIANLCARIQDNSQCPFPTFALALALFDNPAWDILSPERPLRYWRLIEINQPNAQPLTTSALRADERIVNAIKGLNYLDDRLSPLMLPLEVTGVDLPLPPSQQTLVETALGQLQQHLPPGPLPILHLLGSDPLSKQLMAWHIANQLDLYLYRLPIELLPTQTGDLETLARLWHRESLLLPIALYIDAYELTGANETQALQRFLARSQGYFFLDTPDVLHRLGRPAITLDIAKPTPAEQRTAWTSLLADPNLPKLLAGQFNLSLPTIRAIATQPLPNPSGFPVSPLPSSPHPIWQACLAATRKRLDALAQPLNPKATWDDLVLPPDATNLLYQIAEQVRQRSTVYETWGFHQRMNRGLGISVLFAGESGTGKTMAAEVLANDLQLNLYRIDLSTVVSKYIGETEKNLRRLFDAAEDGGMILFFDEADALFGKRSEVQDSHDRYANIEVNYLLQRMESFRGLAILATNMKDVLDSAFLRRLRFIVNFPYPSFDERRILWSKVFPSQTPTEGLDCDRLARLNLTGGNIHNVAINAAFLAAPQNTAVTMPLVLQAVRVELQKLDRPINEAELRWRV